MEVKGRIVRKRVVVMATSKRELNGHLQELEVELAAVGLTISVEKTKAMEVSPMVIHDSEGYCARFCERKRTVDEEAVKGATKAVVTQKGKKEVVLWEQG